LSEEFPAQMAGLRAGSRVAGYRLEAQVGAGGMAVVFRARDERLGRLVALKVLAAGLAADPAFRRRFIAESRAAAAVDDPCIIPIYEAGEADGALFIAMRLVRGGDLRLLLDREGALAPGRAVGFISPVASALDAAHGAGLVHRDVKPANILVDAHQDRPDHVYLSDFGVSKGAISSVSLTGAGHFLGTPDYSAPEQIQGLAVDGRTDQYALACVAYQLLTGARPFERDQGIAVLFAHLSEPPPSLSSRRPGLPDAADRVLARALAKTPEERYGSCAEFADALREALGLVPYHSHGLASASDHPPPETTSRSGFPAPAAAGIGIGKAAIPTDLAAAAANGSKLGGGPAGEAIPAAAAPARAGSWSAGQLGKGGESGRLTGTRDPTGEAGKPVAAEPASAANAGDARLTADAVDPTGASAWSNGAITSATAPQLWSVSNLISRFARFVPLAATGEKITAGPARPSHRARPERTAGTRRRWPIVTISLAVLLAIIIGGGYLGWQLIQEQYYVGADSRGQIVIYRGVNQRIAGISLSKPYLPTGIPLSQVPVNYQQTLKATDAASSLADAKNIVATVSSAVNSCKRAYSALESWATMENKYQQEVALAKRNKKPTDKITKPAPEPARAGATCPTPQAFGIAASALTPSAVPFTSATGN
jgi:serine/threonine protein kinase